MAEKGSQGSSSEAFKAVEAVLSGGGMGEKLDLDSLSFDGAMSFFRVAVESGVSPKLVTDLFTSSNNEILHRAAQVLARNN